jgi:phage N-6-adenine-methyltransferase
MTTGFYSSPQAMSSNDDTWTTPKNYFDLVNAEFDFGLDAAALQSSALCTNWYGPDHLDLSKRNALAIDYWIHDSNGKPIWMNPPYGKDIKLFMAKAHAETKNGATIVCLVPSRTDTVWFQDYALPHEVRYIRGRLKFGGSKNAAPFPSALVVMRATN